MRRAVRAFSAAAEIRVPDHLKKFTHLTIPMPAGRCMIVGKPLYRYPIAVVPPPPEVAPLLTAIRESEARPFRIISYEEAGTGKVFNCSFLRDAAHLDSWLSWLGENALEEGSPFHKCMFDAASDSALPSRDTLLFAQGASVLTDTRFGEYQVGMAINFSRQVPLGAEEFDEMCDVAASAEFEQRIAMVMQENDVAYFGRLAMLEDADSAAAAGTSPALLTVLRYGSVADAERGTALVRELMRPELDRWFSNEHSTLIGTTTQVLEL